VVSVPPIISKIEPAPMEFRVLYEDAELAVIDKPAGVIVHPGAGTSGPTLVNGLLHRYPELTGVGDPDRPGIVHRLDKDTSGCLVVARTDETRRRLISMFACRRVHKEYYALVKGVPQQDQFTIDKEIGRSIHDRKRMSIRTHFGREAVTHATAVETFGAAASALAVRIETGRTHQIRVHLAYAGLPVLGDNVYGRAAHEMSVAAGAARQMLHAHKISFAHPSLQKELVIVSPVPEDMRGVEARLREKYCFSNDPR